MLPSYYFSQKLEPLPSASVIPIFFFTLLSRRFISSIYDNGWWWKGGASQQYSILFQSTFKNNFMDTHKLCALAKKEHRRRRSVGKIGFLVITY